MRRRSERAASDGSAGAWAAAALVLGLGGLLFGVVAHLRTSNLEARVDQLEQATVQSETPSDTSPDEAASPSTAMTATVVETQPDDVAAARKGVTDAYTAVYDGSKPQSARLVLIDDPTDVGAAMTFAAAGDVGQAYERTRARVDEVAFTSADEATVRYRVILDGAPTLDARIGEAVFVDDRWKVTRETVCADLEEVGAPCEL